ncbi:MAG: hypothetical protein R2844_00620 [Caldilineales bacterium]
MTEKPVVYPELIIEDAVGVCGVRDDTRALAEAAAASGLPGRAGSGRGHRLRRPLSRPTRLGRGRGRCQPASRGVGAAQRHPDGLAMRVYQSDMFTSVRERVRRDRL